MSSKEAKALLKDAREAIKNKKFSEAIKLCNKVLKEQNDNYMALLLLGAAYQDSDKKEAAGYLKRAVACTDEPTVALQGLSNCADDTELPGVCEKLLSLTPDKYAELHAKLYGVASRGSALGPTLRVFEKELDQSDKNRQQSAFELLGKIAAQNPDLEKTEADLVACVLEREINNNQDIYQHDKFRRFLKLLHSEKRYERVASISAAMHERFSNDVYPLEWICKLYTEKIVPRERLKELLPHAVEVYVDRALAIAPDSALVLLTKGKLLFAAGRIAEAEVVLKRANDQKPLWVACMELLAEIYFRQKAYGLAEALYRNLNMTNLNYAIALVNDGSLEKLREADECFAKLQAATISDRSEDLLFYWCKRSYSYRTEALYLQRGDKLRARKCLEKKRTTESGARNAVIQLSELYRRDGEWDSNAALLSSSGTGAAWAQLLLGLHHLDRQEYDEAIGAFRTVLRFEVDNSTAWEGLADAYLGRGSYTSAMKVYGKITERDPDNPYPLLQLANIKNSLKLHKEGLALFEQLLARHENYFPAIKGIADSHLGLCFYRRSQRMLGRSRDHAQSCVDYLTKAIKIKPNFVCLWHQLAKVLDTIACFPKVYSYLQLEAGLAGLNDNQQRLTLRRGKLAELASRCYARLVKQDVENDALWYELASNYYRRAMAMNETEMLTAKDDRMKLLNSAYDMAKHSIVLNSARWQNWNLLGVICTTEEINDRALAQHSFIQAVEKERKVCAPAWSNLGVLYLSNGDLGLANKAFSRAQQCDPTFQNAWIGQAIIAECAGHPDEAMDLFRHCTQLGYHPESSLGYAHWVCMVMADESYRDNERYRFAIDDMHALVVSHDSISHHCADRGDEASVPALRFLGNISSRLGLWRTATDAYYRALATVSLGSLPADNTARDEILCDLGYCLMKQQRYPEAVKCYEDMRGDSSFTGSIGRAQAFFRATQYQQSYEEYEKALNYHAKTDLEKAYVLIAMSAMVYAFQGEADAKTILFQCITLPDPPIEALFSACALGLLHNDSMLTELVIKELRKYEDNATHGHNVVYLVSQFYWQNNLKNKCLAYLVSQVHRHPNRPKVWQILSIALLRKFHTPKNLRLASRVAQSALTLDLTDRRSRTRAEDAARWLTVASEAVGQLDAKKHRILAQKAVHLDPTSREAWAAFRQVINPVDSWENL
ncbi:tetratricopeptide repeat protein 37 [Anopheles darlingi]|uniref:Tetratricopeptide repeat protein 37 n=1 Tax=Anopheles darlingi TaxID=43151 RepID=W5JBQ1_ANODA|nr:tetratricopeptide repeat protein 37 [Anopheles darlingi]